AGRKGCRVMSDRPLGAGAIRFVEYLAATSDLGLVELGNALSEAEDLPDFSFEDVEETWSAWARVDGVEVEVNGPHDDGILRRWDPAIPADYNYAILLKVPRDAPAARDPDWSARSLVPRYGRLLAALTGRAAYHTGTYRLVPERSFRAGGIVYTPGP